jgi:hypothetical protein
MELGPRLRALWSGPSLDAMLAAGADPASDRALALRAAHLRSPRHRRRLAGTLEQLVRASEADRRAGASAALPIAREGISEARDSVLALARVLRGAEGVEPRGVALAQQLLGDARSVLYTDAASEAVEHEVRHALDRLGAASPR